jgi:hypothetical protein
LFLLTLGVLREALDISIVDADVHFKFVYAPHPLVEALIDCLLVLIKQLSKLMGRVKIKILPFV